MVPRLANHCQFATCTLIAAITDLHLSPIHDPHSSWHLARRTTLIPFSPANRIVPRIFEGGLPRKLRYQIWQTQGW